MNTELIRRLAESHALPRTVIEHLLAHDESFREMWKDCEQSHEVAQQWRETLPRHLDRIDEYSTLARDLEAEIGRYLEQHREEGSAG